MFLRTSLDEYLTQHGISSETTLNIEYVRAAIPPIHLASFEHDDWVSSVDVLSPSPTIGDHDNSRAADPEHERILSASYDGLLRIWNTSSAIIATSPGVEGGGHESSIKSAKFVSSTKIASSGVDRTIKLWKYADNTPLGPGSLNSQLTLYGHQASVDDLAVHENSNRILSASADHNVGLWSSRKADAPTAPFNLLQSASARRAKRRKTESSSSGNERGPLSLLKSHAGPVSGVIFAPTDPTVGYSASWDHSLKTWDLPTSSLVDTRMTSHSLLSLTALPELNLIATGTSARHITLIDPRTSAHTVTSMTLRGHTNAVVSLAPDPSSPYAIVSGSHDGTCRVWDVRSSKTEREGSVGQSMYIIDRESSNKRVRKQGESTKVFSVAWHSEIGIISAGEDKKVQINRGKRTETIDAPS